MIRIKTFTARSEVTFDLYPNQGKVTMMFPVQKADGKEMAKFTFDSPKELFEFEQVVAMVALQASSFEVDNSKEQLQSEKVTVSPDAKRRLIDEHGLTEDDFYTD